MTDADIHELATSAIFGTQGREKFTRNQTRKSTEDVEGLATPSKNITAQQTTQEDEDEEPVIVYLQGWQLHTLTVAFVGFTL